MTARAIISIILICLMITSYVALRIVKKRHRQDPEWQKKQREREAEYRRKMDEERELEDLAYSSGVDGESYDDDDVEDRQ